MTPGAGAIPVRGMPTGLTSPGRSRFWRVAGLWFSVALLLLSTWFGLKEGTDGLLDAETSSQRVAAAFQCVYGVAAIGCLWALYARSA